jgi:hypothetical protein
MTKAYLGISHSRHQSGGVSEYRLHMKSREKIHSVSRDSKLNNGLLADKK